MTGNLNLYLSLLVAGVLLLGAELIIPGGVLGVVGGLCLLGAVITGFAVFPAPWNLLSAIGILLGTVVGFFIWMKLLPHTRIGKSLTLSKDGAGFKATDDFHRLIGIEGLAATDLRPAGMATIEGRRVDVVSENDWVEAGSTVKVIAVEGNRIIVRVVEQEG